MLIAKIAGAVFATPRHILVGSTSLRSFHFHAGCLDNSSRASATLQLHGNPIVYKSVIRIHSALLSTRQLPEVHSINYQACSFEKRTSFSV